MTGAASVSDVRLTRASSSLEGRGLLGWVSCTYGDLALDGISLRRTHDGRVTLSFPARRARGGREHPYVRPLDDPTRRAIERQVLAALGLGAGEAS